MLIINNQTPIIYNQIFKYLPEPIIYNRKLYTMKPQGSSINKPGSKYSPAPVIYNRALLKTGATDLHQISMYSVIDVHIKELAKPDWDVCLFSICPQAEFNQIATRFL
jgi:hypothetical protein